MLELFSDELRKKSGSKCTHLSAGERSGTDDGWNGEYSERCDKSLSDGDVNPRPLGLDRRTFYNKN